MLLVLERSDSCELVLSKSSSSPYDHCSAPSASASSPSSGISSSSYRGSSRKLLSRDPIMLDPPSCALPRFPPRAYECLRKLIMLGGREEPRSGDGSRNDGAKLMLLSRPLREPPRWCRRRRSEYSEKLGRAMTRCILDTELGTNSAAGPSKTLFGSSYDPNWLSRRRRRRFCIAAGVDEDSWLSWRAHS